MSKVFGAVGLVGIVFCWVLTSCGLQQPALDHRSDAASREGDDLSEADFRRKSEAHKVAYCKKHAVESFCADYMSADAGKQVVVDAGDPVVDASDPVVDAGKPEVDSGKPMVDAGKPEVDSGKPMVEQGKPMVDQGKPMVDQGKPMVDQGKPRGDQGKPGVDQGKPGVDPDKPVVDNADNDDGMAKPGDMPAGEEGSPADPAVAAEGRLVVCGTHLCDQKGKVVQLRGMSSHGLQWYKQCLTDASLDNVVNNWKASVFRISTYVQEDGYETDPAGFRKLVDTLVAKVSERGMYAIIDWHMLTPGDPHANLGLAEEFFDYMAQKHASNPRVIYEIANEPNGANVNWDKIRAYAEKIIPVIRRHDKAAVILVGTPDWSSLGVSGGRAGEIDQIAAKPVTDKNAMYTFHFYAADHKDEYRSAVEQAAQKLPLFVTEFGTQAASGGSGNDFTSATKWIELLNRLQVSYVNWNYSDDGLSGAVFKPGVCKSGAFSSDASLKEAGLYIKKLLQSR